MAIILFVLVHLITSSLFVIALAWVGYMLIKRKWNETDFLRKLKWFFLVLGTIFVVEYIQGIGNGETCFDGILEITIWAIMMLREAHRQKEVQKKLSSNPNEGFQNQEKPESNTLQKSKPINDSIKICPECKTKNSLKAAYCQDCGFNFRNEEIQHLLLKNRAPVLFVVIVLVSVFVFQQFHLFTPLSKANIVNDSVEMVLIPAGDFWMGSPKQWGFSAEHPKHQVYLDAFYIDKYLVTFDQYDKFCEATNHTKPDDDGWGRGTRPVINVSWIDANSYAQWTGKRLPTEAEYEKAIKGGLESIYFWGNDETQAGEYVWYDKNSGGMTHPVGEKKPNPYGLYDIVGNLWEWCSDFYGDGYYAVSPTKNPQGPESGTDRVTRGGDWHQVVQIESPLSSDDKRSAIRGSANPNSHGNLCGFRCAKNP